MQINKSGRIAALLALIALVLFLGACEQKTINQIMAEPDRYANHEVGITGRVVRSYSVLGRGAYEVDDGTGRLWVVSERGVPRSGARIAVKGKIKDGFNLGSIIKLPDPIRSGLVMIESAHSAR
jgi:hypothetical protein